MKNFSFLNAIFGKKETRNATTLNVASINDTTETLATMETVKAEEIHHNNGEMVLHTASEVEAMTVEKALETLKNQYTEKKATIIEKATSLKKLEKALEKAEAEKKKAEAEALVAEAMETATEKEKKCKRYVAEWWHTMADTLAEKYTEAMKAEAEKVAHMATVKKEATEVLEALEAENMTMEEALATVSTEVLEAMKAVATEKATEKKEKALEATEKATEATTMKKATTVAVAHRHISEGRGTEKEVETVALAEVETEKNTIFSEVKKKMEETMKKVAEKVKAETAKVYTISRALATMKEEAETWQAIYSTAGVNIDVATMTPATIFSGAHVYLLCPTADGLKVGTGRGVKPVEKWTLETLHLYIITNEILKKEVADTETMEAHRHTLEKAVEAMKAVKALEEAKKAMKEEKKKAEEKKAETEKATRNATISEIEKASNEVQSATANEKAVAEVLAEVKAEEVKALAEVKEEKKETMETVKEAKKKANTGRGRGTGKKVSTGGRGRGKKATETMETVKAETVKAEETTEKAVKVA